jgi:signal peptide peptidase SppA
MSHQLPHLLTRIFGTPLLIDPAKCEIILQALRPRLDGSPIIPAEAGIQEEARRRKPYTVTEDGIAIINIMGTLVRRASGMDAMSGLSSYTQIGNEFFDAVSDPAIKAILLDVDSPGGEAGGVFDLAMGMFQARSQKPVWAVANDFAFSAAYALASSAERVYVTQTGGVGSVGVIAVHLDVSAFDAKEGLKYTTVFAGDRKADFSQHAPLSKDARAMLQDEIDRLYNIFTASVAQFRGITQSAVKKTEAGLFFGQNGVDTGLADKIGTFDDALLDLRSELNSRNSQNSRIAARKETSMSLRSLFGLAEKPEANAETEEQQVIEQLKAAHQEAMTKALEANTKAVRAATFEEAAHLMELCQAGGHPELAASLIKSGATKEEAGAEILKAKASADPEIHSRVLPGAGTEQPKREDSPLVKAARARVEQLKLEQQRR